MAFEPGDVVMLKSGGHSMTVVSIDEEDIDCLWVSDDGELFRQSIPAVALALVDIVGIDAAEDSEETGEAEHDEEEEGDEDEEEEEEEEEEDDDEEEEEKEKRHAKRR